KRGLEMKKIFKKLKEKLKDIKAKRAKKIKSLRIKKRLRESEEKIFPQETKIEETKYATPPSRKRYPEVEQLPKVYGEDRLVLQSRDPWWIHAYWELTPRLYEKVKSELKDEFFQAKRILRVYDISNIIFDGTNAHRYFDIEINDYANNWYIDVGGPGRSWCVDLGLKLPDNRFITLIRSNVVHTPLDGPSWITDEEWMVPEEVFARLYGMGVGLGLSSPVGKGWQEEIKKRVWQPLASGALASMVSPVKKEERIARKFWLVVNTELILYGATEPDATVYVQGKQIPLRPDGTFSLRFALPDGKQVIPVKGVSGDKLEERTITPIVTKETK
ncbi:MAG: DUF4912 domain-containing protein, partial [Candidatus Omnitrophica bacterium]|nr:DUF4912 domain-containing protein [Candidatus Omnitrophota bacterium]